MKLINNKLLVLSATVGIMCMSHVAGQEIEIEENDLIETVDAIQELDEPIIVDDSLDQIDVEPVSSDFEENPILDAEYQASFSEDGGIQLGDQISFGIEDGSEIIEEEILEQKPVEQETVEEELVEQEIVEKEPVEEKPDEKETVEEESVEEELVEQEIIEKESVEEEPVKEKPVEKEPIEEEPIEEKPVEEEPIEEKPVEEEPVMLDSLKKEIIEEPKLCPFMVHPDNSISEIPAFEGENCSNQIAACSLEGFNLCPDDTVCTNMPVSSSVSYRCDPIVMEQLDIFVEEELETEEEIPVVEEIGELVKEEQIPVVQESSAILVEEQNEIPVVTPQKKNGNNCGLLKMMLFTNNNADFFTKFLLFQSYKNSC